MYYTSIYVCVCVYIYINIDRQIQQISPEKIVLLFPILAYHFIRAIALKEFMSPIKHTYISERNRVKITFSDNFSKHYPKQHPPPVSHYNTQLISIRKLTMISNHINLVFYQLIFLFLHWNISLKVEAVMAEFTAMPTGSGTERMLKKQLLNGELKCH